MSGCEEGGRPRPTFGQVESFRAPCSVVRPSGFTAVINPLLPPPSCLLSLFPSFHSSVSFSTSLSKRGRKEERQFARKRPPLRTSRKSPYREGTMFDHPGGGVAGKRKEAAKFHHPVIVNVAGSEAAEAVPFSMPILLAEI